jgi:hypothetical protein
MPGQRPYRVIQWATGKVGQVAIRHFAANPAFDLVGLYVTNADKVGRDAGEIAGIAPMGITATDDVDAILALEADCVHFAPAVEDIDMLCRILRSGKNVVTPLGPFYPIGIYAKQVAQLEAACIQGGTSFHGSGIHPGFAGDLLPLTLTRLMTRIDHIHVYEIVDHLANPSNYIEYMGFGREPADLLANPARSPDAAHIFAQSMAIVVEALGESIEDVTATLELATATEDIAWQVPGGLGGVVKQGSVGGQHYEWSAIVRGRPFITYHCFWKLGDKVEPNWPCGDSGYRVIIEGEPPLTLSLNGVGKDGRPGYFGLSLTGLLGVNAIPAVCDAAPGVVTHLDLGVFGPPGLVP